MKEFVTVALDAMGGDNAPAEIVKGGVEAVNARKEVKVLMVGRDCLLYTSPSPRDTR